MPDLLTPASPCVSTDLVWDGSDPQSSSDRSRVGRKREREP